EYAALDAIDSFVHLALFERHAVARHLLLVEEITADETPGTVRENDAAAVPEVVPLPTGVGGEVEERLRVARAELGQLQSRQISVETAEDNVGRGDGRLGFGCVNLRVD